MKIFFLVLIFIWLNPTQANNKFDIKTILQRLKQDYQNKLQSNKVSTITTKKQSVSNKEANAISVVNTIINADYNNLLNKLYPDQSVLNRVLKSSQSNFKEILSNPENLIAISLAIALNDSSILYNQNTLVNSLQKIIFKGLSNSYPSTNFNYTCIQDIIQKYIVLYLQLNGDFNQIFSKLKQPILACYPDQILVELKNFLDSISTDLEKLISNKTTLSDLIQALSKYADDALKLLIDILKNQINPSTLKTTTVSSTIRPISSTTSSNSLINQINEIKNNIIYNLLPDKTRPDINDLVDIII